MDTINFVKSLYPSIKVIVSEFTPRNDARDKEVLSCNEMLHKGAGGMENVFIVSHSNLRDENMSMFDDAKHIRKENVNVFAGNIKAGLRKAYGMPRYRSRSPRDDGRQHDNVYDSHPSYNKENVLRTRNSHLSSDSSTRLKLLAGYVDPQTKGNNNVAIQKAIDALTLLIK